MSSTRYGSPPSEPADPLLASIIQRGRIAFGHERHRFTFRPAL